jgi:hypothetical protein
MFEEINGELYSLFQVAVVSKENEVVDAKTNYNLVLIYVNGREVKKTYSTASERDAEYTRIKALTL